MYRLYKLYKLYLLLEVIAKNRFKRKDPPPKLRKAPTAWGRTFIGLPYNSAECPNQDRVKVSHPHSSQRSFPSWSAVGGGPIPGWVSCFFSNGEDTTDTVY